MKWYKMDCDAQENLDMRKLIEDWGWDWYGRYWAILGKIGMLINENNKTFALQTNDGRPFPVKLLANDCQTTVERMTNFLNYLSDNCLIDKEAWVSKSLIYVPKLEKRADEYTRKLLIKDRDTTEQEEDIEEDKKKKENNIYIAPSNHEALEKSFQEFWVLYDKSRGKQNAYKEWLKLTDDERITIFKSLPLYVQNTEKKFRKDPERYLKHKTFNDEVIIATPEKPVGSVQSRLNYRYDESKAAKRFEELKKLFGE